MATEKRFHLNSSQIVELVSGRGGCFATDMIVVEGRPVRYMYREEPDCDIDSGWRFMAGYESVEYMDDPSNVGIYDVNTIANYDRSSLTWTRRLARPSRNDRASRSSLMSIHHAPTDQSFADFRPLAAGFSMVELAPDA